MNNNTKNKIQDFLLEKDEIEKLNQGEKTLKNAKTFEVECKNGIDFTIKDIRKPNKEICIFPTTYDYFMRDGKKISTLTLRKIRNFFHVDEADKHDGNKSVDFSDCLWMPKEYDINEGFVRRLNDIMNSPDLIALIQKDFFGRSIIRYRCNEVHANYLALEKIKPGLVEAILAKEAMVGNITRREVLDKIFNPCFGEPSFLRGCFLESSWKIFLETDFLDPEDVLEMINVMFDHNIRIGAYIDESDIRCLHKFLVKNRCFESKKFTNYLVKQAIRMNASISNVARKWLKALEIENRLTESITEPYPDLLFEREITLTQIAQEARNVRGKSFLVGDYRCSVDDYIIRKPKSVDEIVYDVFILGNTGRKAMTDEAMGNFEIYFMRKKENEHKPYITIIIKDKEVKIEKTFGESPTIEEVEIVNKWMRGEV